MKKITVFINKSWEAEPVLNAMTNPKLRPSNLPFPEVINTPKDKNNKMKDPRAIIQLGKNTDKHTQVTIRCIEDLMSSDTNPSSSEEKYRVLPDILNLDNPDMVISVGTANSPEKESFNGSVIIGGNFFIHDGHPNNPESNLKTEYEGILLSSNVRPELFAVVNNEFRNITTPKFITPPNKPADKMTCIASANYSTVSSINVTDYSEYEKVDNEAVIHFQKATPNTPLNSIETTHAVVKISTDAPIIFIAPITDRLGYFDEDASDTQNYVASFNGGIVLGQLLCSLHKYFHEDKS